MSRTAFFIMPAALALAGVTSVVVACIDFGYRIPTGPDAAPADAAIDSGTSSCVEGAVAPSTSGPQINLVTLNVDKAVVNVTGGTVVTWNNTDSMVHTITAGVPGAPRPPAQGGFDSGDLAPGAKWAWRFCKARTATYFCKTHANQMNGYRIVVAP
jgi:plastocyanin